MIAHNPLHRSQRAGLPHWALALGDNAKSPQGIGMSDARRGQPALNEAPHVDDHQKTQNSERTRKSGVIVAALCCGGAGELTDSSLESGATEAQSGPGSPASRPAVRPPAGKPAALDSAGAPRRAGRVFRVFTCRATFERLVPFS